MIMLCWKDFLDLSDNLVLSGLMGLGHHGHMTMKDLLGTFNNKFAWFKRESISKYDMGVIFMIFLSISLYLVMSRKSKI